MPIEIRAFFDAYCGAFNALNGERVASLYAQPSAIAQAGEFTVWQKHSDAAANMRALCEQYASRGYRGATFEPRHFFMQGENYAVADLNWCVAWAEEPPWEFRTTYNLVRTSEGWRVLLCTAYQEDKLHRQQSTA
jgi:hypothetical protein